MYSWLLVDFIVGGGVVPQYLHTVHVLLPSFSCCMYNGIQYMYVSNVHIFWQNLEKKKSPNTS